jgi:hypothetical protein
MHPKPCCTAWLYCCPLYVIAGYLLSLLASLLLYMHPLRGCLAEMLWPDDSERTTRHLATPATSAAATGVAGATLAETSSSAFAETGTQQQQQQQQQHDHNPIDDSRVLLAFDSMDQPAFGSWRPGGLLLSCYLTVTSLCDQTYRHYMQSI